MKKHYQKYCTHFAYAIISISTILFTTRAVGQENNSLLITEDICRYMKEKDLKLLQILHDTIIETKRPIIFLGNKILNDEEIVGTYSAIPTPYLYARRDDRQGNYIENELVDKTKEFNNYGLSEIVFFLYKNNSTNKLYGIREENLKLLKDYVQAQEMIKIVQKLGYKVYETNETYYENYYYIKSKTCEVKLDNWTYNELKKNPSYINSLDNYQIKLKSLVQQTVPHSKNLDKYIGLYRIQRNKMSTANINAWKNATTQAQKLNNQIAKLEEQYAGNYSFTPFDRMMGLRQQFTDNLGASKGVLGM
ncbi:hypothetical protein N4T20_14455 [Flavobacterium sp. TR2]|uniref:hypothetical protein n=1 Tax=Flavobacterium sp. TR2 TaxID=2977321 RepID=UPI0021B0E405|nr:hypothetical protein [Flavobacterium sp. TR2]UWY26922.1 hypothetical protein N4T20_14455 [Flavobacterium sp. TR2]